MVRQGVRHCLRGDVFQIVLSRRFEQPFQGDDFKFYRALRSINPSPYLFYFDFGGFPHLRLLARDALQGRGRPRHNRPHRGHGFPAPETRRWTASGPNGFWPTPKENAEHVMLVDLARNDLSRNAHGVKVDFTATCSITAMSSTSFRASAGRSTPTAIRSAPFIDTFPAGTLSGAPKVRAMQLISEIEPDNRGVYGGCIGFIGLDGDLNQAIAIRTFVSRNNTLYYQAGAGIVAKSDPGTRIAGGVEQARRAGQGHPRGRETDQLTAKNEAMKCLLFDNYDSFTYNLRHMLLELGLEVDVRRNDRIALDEVAAYDRIVLARSGHPSEAGLLLPLIRRYAASKPILGICLGEQAIGEAFGARLENLAEVHHGVCSTSASWPTIRSSTGWGRGSAPGATIRGWFRPRGSLTVWKSRPPTAAA